MLTRLFAVCVALAVTCGSALADHRPQFDVNAYLDEFVGVSGVFGVSCVFGVSGAFALVTGVSPNAGAGDGEPEDFGGGMDDFGGGMDDFDF